MKIFRIIFNYFLATIIDLFASLRCLFYTLFIPAKLDYPMGKLKNKPEILCVHGYLHNDTPWRPLRRYLQERGAGAVNALRYFSVKEDIPAGGRRLRDKIESLGRPVDILIGHSQGGIICLEYALEHAPKDRMITVVTLASPIHGTQLAKIGWGPSARQMEAHSKYMKSLHNRLKKAEHIRLLALGSKADLFVSSHSALVPEYSFAQNIVFENMGHVNFLFSKRVMSFISNFIFKK